MISELIDVCDTTMRVPFWFFIDLILSLRFGLIYERLLQQPKLIISLCPECVFTFDERHVQIIVFLCCIPCIAAMLFHRVAVWAIYVLLFGATFAWTDTLVYPLILRICYTPWDRIVLEPLIQLHLLFTFLVGVSALILLAVMSFPNRVPIKHWIIVTTMALSIPLLSYMPIWFLSSSGPPTRSCVRSSEHLPSVCTTPAWHTYALALLKLRHCKDNSLLPFDVCTLVDSRYSFLHKDRVCPATPVFRCFGFQCTSNVRDIVFRISPYLLPTLYLLLLIICFHLTSLVQRMLVSFKRELDHYRMTGLFTFINFHWDRLNIAITLALLWIFKVFMVVIFGPQYWPILPEHQNQSTSRMNIPFLHEYTQPSTNQSIFSVLLTRVYVAALVHGSETWLVVFGSAAFFGALAVVVVQLLVKLLDPSGEETSRLFAAAADIPIDLHEWNVIDDPALALDQNDVIAVEMLSGTGWNCAVVFLFLAFQYDLPSLPLAQRICCSIYGVIVIAITCIHPVQALVKSFLLRLDVPGRGSSWMAHIRPLLFCVGLIASSVCILTYVPEGLAERVSEQMEHNSTNQSSPILVPRFGSSIESLKARQLRIVLCGSQLLLGLIVTLIEYFIYQISRRYPNWTGFRPSLFWTRLVSSVIDYLISLLSFLTVCWLSIYDSIGLCRLLIICCYFYFILYPSAVRAYTWIRWRLSFRQRMNSLDSPTEDDLVANGDTCPICYSEMTPATSKVTRCGHLYHTDCLSTWMRRQLFCPICHADLLSTKVVPRRRTVNSERT